MHAIIVRNPFRAQTERDIVMLEAGRTLREVVNDAAIDGPVMAGVNGEAYSREEWDYPIRESDIVTVIALPQGGKSNPLQIVMMIAIMIFAWYAAPMLLPAALSENALALAVTRTIIGMVGMALVNAIIPPPKPTSNQAANMLAAPSPTYSLSAQGNVARLGQAIPVAYGRNRLYPDYGSQPYTEYEGNEQYLYQLFCLGQGWFNIETVSIEDTEIWVNPSGYTGNFSDVTLEFVNPGGTVTLYPQTVVTSTEVAGQEMTPQNQVIGPYVVNAAGTQINAIGLDLLCPQGLALLWEAGWILQQTVSYRFQACPINDIGQEVGAWFDLVNTSFTAATQTPQRWTHRVSVPLGRYKVKGWRTNADSTAAMISDLLIWGSLRGYMPGTQNYGNLTMMAVRMRATNQLTQLSSRKFNVVATRKVPTRSGGAWTGVTATRSIAWAIADIVRSTDYGLGLADASLDISGIEALHTTWEGRPSVPDRFDAVFDNHITAWEALVAVCRAGRAVPVVQGGVIRIVRHEAVTTPVAMFTLRNIVPQSFKLKYLMVTAETTDGAELTYWDENVWNERSVPAKLSGQSALNPAKLRTFGIVQRQQAWREGMYACAANLYQRTIVSLDTELEGLTVSYGDLVAIQHDMPSWNQGGEVTLANLASYSDGFNQSVWTKNTITITTNVDGAADRATLSGTADPYILRTWTTNPKGRSFTWSVYVKGEGASVGKQVVLYLYAWDGSVREQVTQALVLTSGYQRVAVSKTFAGTVGVTYTQVRVRIDAEGSPSWANGNAFVLKDAQMEESESATALLAATGAGYRVKLSEPMTWGVGTHYIAFDNGKGGFVGPYTCTRGAADNDVIVSAAVGVVPYCGFQRERTKVIFAEDTDADGKPFRFFRVIGVQPQNNRVALMFVNEDDRVHTADSGTAPAPPTGPGVTPPPLKPAIPGVLYVNITGSPEARQVGITWAQAPGADYYIVQVSYDNITWQTVGEPSSPQFSFTTQPLGDTASLYIRVAPVGRAQGDWLTWNGTVGGNPVGVITPEPVTNLQVSAGLATLWLEWDPLTGTALAQADRIEVWRSQSPPGQSGSIVATLPPTQYFYADAIGVTGATYYYQLRVISRGGTDGTFSVTAGGTTGQMSGGDVDGSGGGNVLVNSELHGGQENWGLGVSGNTTGNTYGADLAGYSVSSTYHTAYVHQGNNDPTALAEQYSAVIPVIPGQHWELSAYTGAHRCNVTLFMYLYNGSTYLTGYAIETNAQEAIGGTSLNLYKRLFGVRTIPATAGSPAQAVNGIRFLLRKGGTLSGADSWMFFTQPMLRQTLNPNQTVPTPFLPSPVGIIRKVMIGDATIDSAKLAAASVGTAHIITASVQTLHLGLNQVTVPVSTFGGLAEYGGFVSFGQETVIAWIAAVAINPTHGQPIFIHWGADILALLNTGSQLTWGARIGLFRDYGVLLDIDSDRVYATGGLSQWISAPRRMMGAYSETPPAGNHTYAIGLYVYNQGPVYGSTFYVRTDRRTLLALECQR